MRVQFSKPNKHPACLPSCSCSADRRLPARHATHQGDSPALCLSILPPDVTNFVPGAFSLRCWRTTLPRRSFDFDLISSGPKDHTPQARSTAERQAIISCRRLPRALLRCRSVKHQREKGERLLGAGRLSTKPPNRLLALASLFSNDCSGMKAGASVDGERQRAVSRTYVRAADQTSQSRGNMF